MSVNKSVTLTLNIQITFLDLFLIYHTYTCTRTFINILIDIPVPYDCIIYLEVLPNRFKQDETAMANI